MTRYLEQAKGASEARLMLALDRLIAVQNDMRYLPAPRALLESALIHICRPEDALTLTNIEARLDRLESALKEGVPAKEQPAQRSAPKPEKKPEAKPEPKPEATPAPNPGEDEVPWVMEPPVQFSEIVADNPREETPKPQTPAQSKAKAADTNDAAAIWREAITNIPNMFIQALAREAVAIRFEQNTLTVGFTAAQETKLKNLSAPVNFEPTQRALQCVKPDAKLIVTTAKPAPSSDQAEALAKELFGDKLTIE